MAEPRMSERRIRIFSSVYCVETGNGVHVKGVNGSFDVAGKGTYELMGWLIAAFSHVKRFDEVIGTLPERLRPHAANLLEATIRHGLAREFASPDDECAAAVRNDFPELIDTLDAIAPSPRAAWDRIQSARLALLGKGTGFDAIGNLLPDYGFRAPPAAAAAAAARPVHAGLEDTWAAAECLLIALEDGAGTDGLIQTLQRCEGARRIGLVTHARGTSHAAFFDEVSGPGLALALAAIDGSGAAARERAVESPAALTIAANHVCIKLFESFSRAAGTGAYVFDVDDATLAASMHQFFLPEAIWGARRALLSGPDYADIPARQNYGSSLAGEARFGVLDRVAGAVAALIDQRFGPLLAIDDISSRRAPTPQVWAHVKLREWEEGMRLLVPGLSMRECHNQAALSGIEHALRREMPQSAARDGALAFGCGWNIGEAVQRALRTLALDMAEQGHLTPLDASRLPLSEHEFRYFSQSMPFEPGNVQLFKTRHDLFAARLERDAWIAPSVFGAGETAEQAVIDLLLRRAGFIGGEGGEAGVHIAPAIAHPASDDARYALPLTRGLQFHRLDLAAVRPCHSAFADLHIAVVSALAQVG